jgi:hypothetical protein
MTHEPIAPISATGRDFVDGGGRVYRAGRCVARLTDDELDFLTHGRPPDDGREVAAAALLGTAFGIVATVLCYAYFGGPL